MGRRNVRKAHVQTVRNIDPAPESAEYHTGDLKERNREKPASGFYRIPPFAGVTSWFATKETYFALRQGGVNHPRGDTRGRRGVIKVFHRTILSAMTSVEIGI
ncbi:MAG: hypothetical protein PHS17_04530 [Desulfobacterales bacterium]|nr:hypothetical protein [Desulfobacterales bacterium]